MLTFTTWHSFGTEDWLDGVDVYDRDEVGTYDYVSDLELGVRAHLFLQKDHIFREYA